MSELWRKLTNKLLDSPREAEGIKLTCLPSYPDKRDFSFKAFAGATVLPRKFSRRAEMPSVADQGNAGSCVGHSFYYIKSWQEKQQRDIPSSGLSRLFIYSVCKKLDGLNSAGTYPKVAVQVLQKYGICSEEKMPYSLMTDDVHPPEPSQQAYQEATNYKIKAYARCYSVDDIKRAIFEQGPVNIDILVCKNFLYPENGKFVYFPEGDILGGHALTGVGWDDDMEYTYKNGVRLKGFVLILNSWGDKYGDNGYIWIPYAFFSYKTQEGIPAVYESWSCVDIPYQLRRAKHIIFKIDDPKTIVDGQELILDQPPFITNADRTVLPVRFFSEQIGYLINWQPETGIVEAIDPSKF